MCRQPVILVLNPGRSNWATLQICLLPNLQRLTTVPCTTTEAFPLPVQKEELVWACLVKAAAGNNEMITNLEVLENNSWVKSRLIDYVHA